MGKLPPRKTLWHAVLFYLTGEIVRQHIPGYKPYALRRGSWGAGLARSFGCP